MDVRLYNVIVLGISFMMIFTAFQTASMSEVCYQWRHNLTCTVYLFTAVFMDISM